MSDRNDVGEPTTADTLKSVAHAANVFMTGFGEFSRRMDRFIGTVLVIVAAVCFGFMGLFASWVTKAGVSEEMMLFLRFLIAGFVMSIVMVVRGMRWPRGRVLLGLIGMGGVLYVGESLFYFHAAKHLGSVGLASLLLYIYPVVVTMFAWLVLKEQLTVGRVVALVVAVAGLMLTIGPLAISQLSEKDPSSHVGLGIALGLGCCVSYAIYILCGARLSQQAGAIPASTVVVLSAAAVLGAVSLSKGDALPSSMWTWLGIVLLAMLSTVVAITAVLAGLERIGAVQTSTLSTLEPVITVLVGALLMGESLSWIQMIGGGLIVLAAVIVARCGTNAVDDRSPSPKK
jgi:drug/metabolite transporter (DMT)-like permease